MTLPNMITLFRLFLVPVVVWTIAEGRLDYAFWLFIAAGISDGVDGFIAKKFDLVSDLGAYLDPLADKALLISIYLALGFRGDLPIWLPIMVVSRDVLIIGAVVLSWMLGQPVEMRPLIVSKANTVVQIVLAAFVLGAGAFQISAMGIELVLIGLVASLTVASGIVYLVDWFAHMGKTLEDG